MNKNHVPNTLNKISFDNTVYFVTSMNAVLPFVKYFANYSSMFYI